MLKIIESGLGWSKSENSVGELDIRFDGITSPTKKQSVVHARINTRVRLLLSNSDFRIVLSNHLQNLMISGLTKINIARSAKSIKCFKLAPFKIKAKQRVTLTVLAQIQNTLRGFLNL